MTTRTRAPGRVRPWRTGLEICGWSLTAFVLLTAVAVAVAAALPGTTAPTGSTLSAAVGWSLLGTVLPVALLGVPGSALAVALTWARPVGVRLAALGAAGAVVGFLARGGEVWFALLDAGADGPAAVLGSRELSVVVGAGCAVVGCVTTRWRTGRRAPEAPDALPEAPDGAPAVPTWPGPLAWLVGVVGILMAPAWTAFGALITAASFFGEPGDPQAAAGYLWTGAAVAAGSTAVVVVVAAFARRRGGSVRGRAVLLVLGVTATLLLTVAAADMG